MWHFDDKKGLERISHFEGFKGVLVSLITLSVAVITCSKTLSTLSVALTTPSEALPQLDPHPLKFFHTLQGSCYRI